MPNPNKKNEYIISPTRNVVIKLQSHSVKDGRFICQRLLVIIDPREINPNVKHIIPMRAKNKFCVKLNNSIWANFCGNVFQLSNEEP
jgi:hypothetical protein